MQLMGRTEFEFDDLIWRIKIPGKVRFFAWLAIQGKCLTADNLAKRNWPHNPLCPLCNLGAETATHLLASCPFAAGIWGYCLTKYGFPLMLMPGQNCSDLKERWLNARNSLEAKRRSHFSSIVMTTWWFIWRERNERIFY